jgi:LacI family transcriptional regulator
VSTIKDVALRAGVSFTTVSHVVNGTRRVSDEARLRVEAAMAELGYVRSAVARALKTSETHILGVVVPNITNPFFAELTRGVEDFARRTGYSVFLCNSDDDKQRQIRYIQTLLERRVDGVLLAASGHAELEVGPLQGARVPCVVVDRVVKGFMADCVRLDNVQGARLAVEHLLSLGHRQIACISGPSGLPVSQERVAGWRQALMAAGIEPPASWCLEGDFTAASGYAVAQALLAQGEVTAIFASNDLMALGVLRAAAERGLMVPSALSVMGFDGIELGNYTHPALSTVAHSVRAMGEAAASMLMDRIASSASARVDRVLPMDLLLRGSTAQCGTSAQVH